MELTLSFFSRVSPLVILQAGGAGAPDLGGLLSRVMAVVASGRPAGMAGGREEGATYPSFFSELTLAFFATYPIFFATYPSLS